MSLTFGRQGALATLSGQVRGVRGGGSRSRPSSSSQRRSCATARMPGGLFRSSSSRVGIVSSSRLPATCPRRRSSPWVPASRPSSTTSISFPRTGALPPPPPRIRAVPAARHRVRGGGAPAVGARSHAGGARSPAGGGGGRGHGRARPARVDVGRGAAQARREAVAREQHRFDTWGASAGQPPIVVFKMSRPGAPEVYTVRTLK